MFLKALTLKGFKSFADTTVLELEPGVTVVVGPNGSGKSNVVDAIAWVLGAQAPSAVRSQKMEDVIFAGTSRRAALGRAEVSLTIDNSAGLLPIEFTEVSVSRTLWRSGESEYAINGVNCRLLDVQELFSDTGVGRQQHLIVGQGQIDGVLNARPEDRRVVVEEAAGILKHRRRKDRSERRLAATEGNLTRLQDLLREVRRQLRPLERQAEAARRHGDLVAELRALQIFNAGRELTTLRRRLADAGAARAELRSEEEMCKRRLGDLDAAAMTAEADLAALGGDDTGEVLGRVGRLAEKGRGLLAVIAERARGLERERAAFVDRAVVASLEADAAALRQDLAQVEADAERLRPERDALGEDERALAAARADFESRWPAGVEAPTARAAETRGELLALRAGLERGEADLRRTRALRATVRTKVGRLDAELAGLAEATASTEAAAGELDADVAAAQQRAAAAGVTLAEAESRRDATRADHQAWTARAEALGVALDEARVRADADALAHLDGVIGALRDLVEVDPGWESAFEAACGEALAAVVVDSVDAGRRALEVLAAGDLPGAVLAVGGGERRRGASGGEPVLAHVRAHRPEVGELLTALIGHAVAVDGPWQAALDAALAHPGALVVTLDGARFGPTGWRVTTATSPATGAALDEARQRAAEAASTAAAAQSGFEVARVERDEARAAATAAIDRRDERRQGCAGLAAARERADRERTEAVAEVAALDEQVGELDEHLRRERARATELAAALPSLEAAEADLHERAQAMADARDRLEERAATVGSRRADIEVRSAGIEERRSVLTRRLEAVEQRLAGSIEARRQAEERRVELDRHELALERLAAFVEERTTLVQTELAALTERRRRQTEAQRELSARLEDLRRDRSDAERRLESLRERASRSEVDEAEVRLRLEQATEMCRTQLDVEPHTAMAAGPPELPDGTTPAARVRDLERELRLMGPINPLALEEFDALSERHAFLQEQLDDVKSTRRDLFKIIRAIDNEIVRVFAAAFADISENFEQLFATLFPGGLGRLRLTDPDDLLNCGVEVEAKPSGKNVRKLSLLSGGERSLTALAFLFSVFRSRPSPFYVMDEVEAALDDVNLHRFLDLVAEFRREAQLIIVSHQKRTMEAADCLFGVTMQPGGSSKVISERVAARA